VAIKDGIVEAQLFARDPGGVGHSISVRIDRPRPNPDQVDGGCAVELTGIRGEASTIVGLDAMQPLSLTLSYVRMRLTGLREQGWEFYHEEADTEPVDFGAWFSVR
jgi:hypothetical protein